MIGGRKSVGQVLIVQKRETPIRLKTDDGNFTAVKPWLCLVRGTPKSKGEQELPLVLSATPKLCYFFVDFSEDFDGDIFEPVTIVVGVG